MLDGVAECDGTPSNWALRERSGPGGHAAPVEDRHFAKANSTISFHGRDAGEGSRQTRVGRASESHLTCCA
jgi:hypothetical protein